MALGEHALVTLATVLDELGLTSDAGVQDARLERYINAVSAKVASYCGRGFHRVDDAVELKSGHEFLTIAMDRWPILAIDSIVVGGTTVTASTYDIREAGIIFREGGWTWDYGRGHIVTGDPIPGAEDRNYTVTYDAGYVTGPQAAVGGTFAGETITLPDDLADAVVQEVAGRWHAQGQPGNIKSQSLLGGSITYGSTGASLSDATRELLDGSYRRFV